MKRKPISKLFLLFLLGAICGILAFWQISPRLESLFFSKETSKTPQILPEDQEEQPKLCQIKRKKSIEVDLTWQRLMLCEDGKAIEEFSISTGKKESPTPAGDFNVIHKTLMLYSKLADCWQPFWVGFGGDYGFHELPVCEGGQKRVGEEEIGQPASIGCVRLKIGEAETLYDFAEIGTPVLIYGETP